MRALRLIGDVRPHETGRVLLLQLNLFVLMAGNYVLKTVREPLVLLAGGAELRAYASLGQALLLVAFIPAFGWLASRVDRRLDHDEARVSGPRRKERRRGRERKRSRVGLVADVARQIPECRSDQRRREEHGGHEHRGLHRLEARLARRWET